MSSVTDAAAQCCMWSPGDEPSSTGAFLCTECKGTWLEHTAYHGADRLSLPPMPRTRVPLQDRVSPNECRHWRPVRAYPRIKGNVQTVCAGCGGIWTDHSRIVPAIPGSAPSIPIKAPGIGTPLATPTPSAATACGAFNRAPGGRAKHISADECGNCHYPRSAHAEPMYLGEKKAGVVYHDVLVRNVAEADGRSITVGIGRHNDRDVAFIGTTRSLEPVRGMLAGDWGSHGVLVWVPVQDIQVTAAGQGDVISPAVYIGEDLRIPGRKPTLVEGQGVLTLRSTVSAKDSNHTYDVIYDLTDNKYADCEWSVGMVITDVAGHDLVMNGNWRRHVPFSPYSSVSRQPLNP